MVIRRRKGIAIVETSKGVLVVGGSDKKFMLPGGGADRWESRKKAAIRELYEETGLHTKKIKYLFRDVGGKWRNYKGQVMRNYTKVFLIEAEGRARPRSEVKYIDYWKPKSKIKIILGTSRIIRKYLKYKK